MNNQIVQCRVGPVLHSGTGGVRGPGGLGGLAGWSAVGTGEPEAGEPFSVESSWPSGKEEGQVLQVAVFVQAR